MKVSSKIAGVKKGTRPFLWTFMKVGMACVGVGVLGEAVFGP
ncbi:MAG: hypothetical protein ABDK94_09645 [Atribacterota bacterium]